MSHITDASRALMLAHLAKLREQSADYRRHPYTDFAIANADAVASRIDDLCAILDEGRGNFLADMLHGPECAECGQSVAAAILWLIDHQTVMARHRVFNPDGSEHGARVVRMPELAAVFYPLDLDPGETCNPDEADRCGWFALCDNPASGYVLHPVLGGLPTCDRCREVAEAQFAVAVYA